MMDRNRSGARDIAARIPVIGWDRQTKQDKLDAFILKVFPGFVVVFGVIAILVFLFYWDGLTVGHLLYSLGAVYAGGFVLLGIPAFILSESDVVKARYSVPFIIVAWLAISSVLWFVFGDGEDTVNHFVSGFSNFLNWSVHSVTFWTVLLGMLVLILIVLFASYGILSVIVAYFRKDYHRIMLSLIKPGDSRLKRSSTKLFAVPSIIDVTDVTIEPESDDGHFNIGLFKSLSCNTVVAGLIVASYLFLNPVFLDTISFTEMMVTLILISLFLNVLIIPISILKSLKAEAWSAAPRPFVLWKGMKSRMFQGYVFVFLMLTLLWICLYSGQDMVRVVLSYIGYIVFIIMMSALTSFVYVNTFYVGFKNGIVRNFTAEYGERKKRN